VLLTLLLTGIQLASSPSVPDADPKRNLLWRDEDMADSFIICLGLLLLTLVLACLAVVSWLICQLLVREFPSYSSSLRRPILFGLLGSVIGMLLTYHYASLQFIIIPFPCIVSLLITGTLLGYFTCRTEQDRENV
jgi:hypothetical protein